jgi:sulfate transport system ATP-binding protein
MSITVSGISKKFGSFQALDTVDLDVQTGELIALLGPSGSGKTTLLRIIAGLEEADAGQVLFYGNDTASQGVRERQVGFVFQHYALFKHMSVFDNVAFGLRVKRRGERRSRADVRERVEEMLKLVQIDWLANRFPSQLSGGQRQRVALARALITEPKVLLLDEPFGALDAKVRKELRRWLRRLHHEMNITSVFVTHDQEEALEVADRVVVMNKGRIEQIGTPEAVYDDPASPFVYEFLGNVNRLEGEGRVSYVRPHDLVISRETQGEGAIAATIDHVIPIGSTVRLMLSRSEGPSAVPIEAELDKEQYRTLTLREGERVFLTPRRPRVFDASQVEPPKPLAAL